MIFIDHKSRNLKTLIIKIKGNVETCNIKNLWGLVSLKLDQVTVKDAIGLNILINIFPINQYIGIHLVQIRSFICNMKILVYFTFYQEYTVFKSCKCIYIQTTLNFLLYT